MPAGCGVTELISLTLEQVSMRQGVVRTFGKGTKSVCAAWR